MFPQSEDNMDIDSDLPPINIPHLIDELGEHPQPGSLGPKETRLLLQQEFERMLEDAYQETHLGAGVEDQFIADELPKAGDDEDEEDAQCFDSDLLQSEEYFPYPNKTVRIFVLYRVALIYFVRSCCSILWTTYLAAVSRAISSLSFSILPRNLGLQMSHP
jgi:hypothetical protein